MFFDGEYSKEVNGNDLGTNIEGIVNSLREKGSPLCRCETWK